MGGKLNCGDCLNLICCCDRDLVKEEPNRFPGIRDEIGKRRNPKKCQQFIPAGLESLCRVHPQVRTQVEPIIKALKEANP